VTAAVLARVSERTRLAVIDHITSPTALIFPIADLVKELDARGVDTLVDGAHAPGMVPVDVRALGAAYYTANCHKWLCAPKGAAFLHVRRDRQDQIRPTVISHGASAELHGRSRFRLEFDWVGTDDPTAFLSVPAALRFVGGLVPGGWPEVMRRNHALALEARGILCDALGMRPPVPDDMLGSMAALELPGHLKGGPSGLLGLDPLQDELFAQYGIEVPVFVWPAAPRRLIRVSAQLYNTPDHYRRLAAALLSIERRG
jgi:isopenicillin-N epimerase